MYDYIDLLKLGKIKPERKSFIDNETRNEAYRTIVDNGGIGDDGDTIVWMQAPNMYGTMYWLNKFGVRLNFAEQWKGSNSVLRRQSVTPLETTLLG